MTHEIKIQEPTVAPAIPDNLSRSDFLRALFAVLDEREIRYCVLHTWRDLPETLSSDLDIAVHPHDRAKLPTVFESLRRLGVLPVQCQHYAVQGYAFFFLWFCGSELKSAQLDVIFEYRHAGLSFIPGEQLVRGRRRYNSWWIPDPLIAFRYLLIKKTVKGDISQCQQAQLKKLAAEIGLPSAEMISAELFGEKWKVLVASACLKGTLETVLPRLARPLRLTSIVRNPGVLVRYFAGDSARLVGRWLRPAGICLVILGPDGVGKSTLAGRLADGLKPVFDRQRLFHFRPQVFAPQTSIGPPSTDPQGAKIRGRVGSVAHLFAFFMDCWIGYLLSVRPILVRSGLVIFDRSFHDVMIDSSRYRYGGPRWLPRLLTRFVPPFGATFLVLDAKVSAILSRKREVAPAELKRLRSSYAAFASKASPISLISTDRSIEESLSASLRTISQYLTKRFERRHVLGCRPTVT